MLISWKLSPMGNRIRWDHRFPQIFTQRMDATNLELIVFSQVDGVFVGRRRDFVGSSDFLILVTEI